MNVEIPVCRRCCCCLPLRYGLLAWGYIKIIADLFSMPLMVYYLFNTIVMISLFGQTKHLNTALLHFAISIFGLTTFMTDFMVTIVLIVGGHTKSTKLLKGYYIYSIVMLILTAIFTSTSIFLAIINCTASDHDIALLEYCSLNILLVTCSAYFVILASQTYFLLLLRSEIIKLRNNSAFRFVNNAAEAECTMIVEEKLVEQETETEDILKEEHDVNLWRTSDEQALLT